MTTPKPKLKPNPKSQPQSSSVSAASSAATPDTALATESVDKQSDPVEVVSSVKEKKRSVDDGQGEAVSRSLKKADSKPIETESDPAKPAIPPSQKKQPNSTDFGGFGMGKMKELARALEKAKELEEWAKKLQAELDQMELEAESSDGLVKVFINGSHKPLRVTIAPSAIDGGAQVLSDLVLEAWSSAYQKSAATMRSRMEELLGGLNLPGMES